MKKLISVLMAISFLLGMAPITASANAEYVEFEFQIYDDTAFLIKYNGYADEIVNIPATYENRPVTYIDQRAFKDNTVMKTVTIPDTVTYIGYQAFMGCSNLENVTFPENLKTIQAYAFYECPKLKSVTLPQKVLEIFDKALGYVADWKTGDNYVLSNFTINGYTNSAAEIYAKEKDISFVSIGVAPLYIYEVKESYGDEPERARITKYLGVQKDVVVPSEIDGYAIDEIFIDAFRGNSYIETVTVPASVYSIYEGAFASCNNLKTVTFQSESLIIGEKAFYDCEQLSSLVFAPDVPYFDPAYDKVQVEVEAQALEGTAYYTNNFKDNALYLETALVKVDNSIESFTIPAFVRSISPEAFQDCTNLKTIYIPENVMSIGHNAFRGCSSLNNVEFAVDSRCYVYDFAFLNCNLIKSVKFPQNVDPSLYSVGYSYEYVEDLGYWTYVKQPNFKVYGVKGSEAERFADRNEFEFVEHDFSSHTHRYDNACDTSCNTCGATRKITHNYSAATCTKAATCKVCGATNGKALGHSYKTTTTKATLSKSGSIVKKCSVCGKVASTTAIRYAKTVKLSTISYTYNGKAKKPSVIVKDSAGKTVSSKYYTVTYASGRKNVGTYKVTVKFKGNYSGTKTLTFKINPQGTTVKSLTAGKKSLKVSITKKSTQVTGYEVQYSTSKKFTKATTKAIKSYKTTSLTLKSLSAKKTYYVRVRTYKTVNGKKYYSGWSTAKSKKTK